MQYEFYVLSLAAGLFFSLLLCLEVGRRVGQRRLARDPEGARAGVAAVEGALFGLLGLMIAFTFSGAASRFDNRRHLIVEETNHIGTAYLRLDVLPNSARERLRAKFREYLDVRLDAYRRLPDIAAAKAQLANAVRLQGEIWRQAVTAVQADGAAPGAPMLLLPALNAMIDITTTRTLAMEIHPPAIIFVMLFAVALVTSLLVGYGMAGRKSHSWLHTIGFAFAIAAAVYVILDIEHPRFGLIRIEAFDRALVELRESME
jgi:hypothetical protein